MTQSDFFDIAGFENSIIGAGGRLQFPLSDTDQLGLRYRLRSDNLQLDELLPGEDSLQTRPRRTARRRRSSQSSLCDQRGDRLTSSLGYTVTMNRTNDYVEADARLRPQLQPGHCRSWRRRELPAQRVRRVDLPWLRAGLAAALAARGRLYRKLGRRGRPDQRPLLQGRQLVPRLRRRGPWSA